MMFLWSYVMAVLAVVVGAVSADIWEVGGTVKQMGVDVGVMVSQMVGHHLSGCHLVLITTAPHSQHTFNILRSLSGSGKACVVVEAGTMSFQDQLAQSLWGDSRTTCRGLILDLTDTKINSISSSFRLLESSGLWKMPDMWVVVMGRRTETKAVLYHKLFRNTINALYLGFDDLTFQSSPHHHNTHFRIITGREDNNVVWVYQRCLYCNDGEADVRLVPYWNLTHFHYLGPTSLNEPTNMMGHKLRIVALPLFPYMDFRRILSSEVGGLVTPRDSLDARIIASFAETLNFTFQITEEPKHSFGDETNGSYTGLIGQLQREEADFCTIVAPTPGRLKVTDFARSYPADILVIISLKPSVLPEYLAVVRPFKGELWLALLVSVVAWGLILWLLQRAWHWAVGGRVVQFITAFLYGWGALLANPPSNPSVDDSGRVLVGVWLVFCLVITTGFQSSLIAHLTVQGKSPATDSFQDLVEKDNWRWGSEPWWYSGAILEYFSKHTDPVVKQVHKKMEVLVLKEALKKVLAGGFSFLTVKNYITVIITSSYTDANGQTPIYISKKEVNVMACFGWGLRKGAPFHRRFVQLMSRLEDAGILQYWIEEAIQNRVKKNREATALNSHQFLDNVKEESQQKVLGINHLQGAFYLLFAGSGIAFLAMLGENLVHWRSSPQ